MILDMLKEKHLITLVTCYKTLICIPAHNLSLWVSRRDGAGWTRDWQSQHRCLTLDTPSTIGRRIYHFIIHKASAQEIKESLKHDVFWSWSTLADPFQGSIKLVASRSCFFFCISSYHLPTKNNAAKACDLDVLSDVRNFISVLVQSSYVAAILKFSLKHVPSLAYLWDYTWHLLFTN